MKKILTPLTLLIVFHLSAQKWEVLYENDPTGASIQGDIQNLKDAVRQGEEIRISWWFNHPQESHISVEHVADASFLTILSDSIVYTQIHPIYGQSPDFENGTITLRENLEWTFVGGTNGKMDSMTRNTITGEVINHSTRNYGFKWYVRR